MNNEDKYKNLGQLLLQVEAVLRDEKLWQEHSPSLEALSSRIPFCVDTLNFTQWLQFVMIPRFNQLITLSMKLPCSSNISSFAEEALRGMEQRQLISLLQQIDELLISKD